MRRSRLLGWHLGRCWGSCSRRVSGGRRFCDRDACRFQPRGRKCACIAREPRPLGGGKGRPRRTKMAENLVEAGEEDLEQAVRRKMATQQLGSSRTTAQAKTITCHKMREKDTQEVLIGSTGAPPRRSRAEGMGRCCRWSWELGAGSLDAR